MIGLLVALAKYLFYGALLYLSYIIYAFVYIPWKARRKYYKHPNVGMAKVRYPAIGDLPMMFKNERENKFRFQHYLDTVYCYSCKIYYIINNYY